MTQPQKNLTYAVVDFFKGHQPDGDPILQALLSTPYEWASRSYNGANLTLFASYGNKHHLATGTKVFFNFEPTFKKNPSADWIIDWNYSESDSRLRLPFWVYHYLNRSVPYEPSPLQDRAFCNFIYTNPGCQERNAFFELLNARESVDSLGVLYNNIRDERLTARRSTDWANSKLPVLRDYRFTIAFENSENLGHTTEKMIDAWLADSIPIYWGNPVVEQDFPKGSYLSYYEYGSFSRLVDAVLEIHHDETAFTEIVERNPFRTGVIAKLLADYSQSLQQFTSNIASDVASRRRPHRLPTPGATLNYAADSARLTRAKVRFKLRKFRNRK